MTHSPIPTDPALQAAGAKPRDDELDVFGLTHRGKVRPDNQDHYLFCTVHKTLRVHTTSLVTPELLEIPSQRLASLFMVADGVGGSQGGEDASRVTVETMALYATHAMRCYFRSEGDDGNGFLHELEVAAQTSNNNVAARARERPEIGRMATTLTLGLAVWPRLYILQVGDSRAYRFRDDELTRLTRDQTMAQDLVDRGALKPADAERSPLRNILSSAIGRNAAPEVTEHDLRWGDLILLCSDGLSSYVQEDQILSRCRARTSAEDLCQGLLELALEAGGPDNITILAAQTRTPAG
ncbi:MAG: protein phosphatase 2C domain-containing protein [Actinomycetota bacterium]|nr:protein phosphatase 2C domain-containing protein [Actinomycetota bacterium]